MPGIYGPSPSSRGPQPPAPTARGGPPGGPNGPSDWEVVGPGRTSRGGPEPSGGSGKSQISLAPAGGLTSSKGWASTRGAGGQQQQQQQPQQGEAYARGGAYAVLGGPGARDQPQGRRDSQPQPRAGDRNESPRNNAPAPAAAPAAPSISIEKVEEQANIILDEYLSAGDANEAAECIRDLRCPDFHPDFILFFVNFILEKKDKDREKLAILLKGLASNGVITTDQLSKGFNKILETIPDTLIDFPFAPRLVATSIGTLVADNKLPLSFTITALSHLISEGPAPGVAASMAGEILRSAILHRKEFSEKEKREYLFNFARNGQKDDSFLVALTKDKALASLFPSLSVQKDLEAMIQDGKSIDSILKWIENAAPEFQADKSFTHWLMRTVLSKAINRSDVTGEVTEESARSLADRLTHYALLLQRFLDTTPLQLAGVFEVQAFWHSLGEPKHLLAFIFQRLYDDDVVLEESFRVWNEDTDDTTPGKTSALIQTNRWLQWLETAEEESGDETTETATA